MTMQRMVEILELRGFKTTKQYSPKEHAYEFTIERNGLKLADWFEYRGDGKTIWKAQEDFLDKMISNFERLEKIEEKEKKSMKNIAFDISRDGSEGKLVIKNNVYDVFVKEVDSYGSPYDTKTVLKAEIADKSPIRYELKTSTRTDGIMAQIEAYKVMTTFNPARKDSINDGKVQIKDVIFNPPATIVFWSDDTKTVVKAENEVYDPEKGLAMAIAKRALGNQGNYFDTFKKYVEPYKKKLDEDRDAKIAAIYSALEKPYRIWYSYYDENGILTGSGVYHKEYVRRCDATRVAKKRYDGNNKYTVRWIVARENPWISGEWDRKFGSDS